jgi:ribonuclease HI
MEIYVNVDASCKNEKSKSASIGIGVSLSVIEEEGRTEKISYGEFIGYGTSNDGEWLALVDGIKQATIYFMQNFKGSVNITPSINTGYTKSVCSITIYSDSKLVVNQVNGTFSIKQPKFEEYYDKFMYWLDCLPDGVDVKVVWVERNKNKRADELSRKANPFTIKS